MFSFLGGTFLPYDHGVDFKISLRESAISTSIYIYCICICVCYYSSIICAEQ